MVEAIKEAAQSHGLVVDPARNRLAFIPSSIFPSSRSRSTRTALTPDDSLMSSSSSSNAAGRTGQGVYGLPPEVLARIFLIAHNLPEPVNEEYWIPKSRLPTRVRVSHVSRCWRSVALDCATLWADLQIEDRTPPGWVDAQFARTKKALLDVKYSSSRSGPPPESIVKVLSVPERLKNVTLWAPGDTLDALLSMLAGNFPALEKLYAEPFDDFEDTHPRMTPLNGLVFQSAPSLQILSLGCHIPWDHIPVSANMQSLSILRGSPEAVTFEGSRPTADHFAECLGRMSSLAVLKLQSRLPLPVTSGEPVPRLHLPSLLTIEFKDTAANISAFFKTVLLSFAVDIKLDLDDFPSPEALAELLQSIKKAIHKEEMDFGLGNSLSIWSPDEAWDSTSPFALVLDFDRFKFLPGISSDTKIQGLHIDMKLREYDGEEITAIIAAVSRVLDHSKLFQLACQGLGIHHELLRGLFVQLPYLLELELSSDAAALDDFLEAWGDGTGTPLLPLLHVLKLDGMNFKSWTRHLKKEALISRLIASLKGRPQANQVKALVIKSSENFSSDDYSRICDAEIPGLKVEWDEFEDCDSDYDEEGYDFEDDDE